MNSRLRYVDEKDRSYGLAGVAISLVTLEGAEFLSNMSIDAPTGEGVQLSQDFYFIGNPRMSAKIAWNEILKHVQLSSGMVISNVMCRNYVQHHRKLSSDLIRTLKDFIKEEARESCSLDDDESEILSDKLIKYFDRVFSYSQVHDLAHEFADTIVNQRQLTAREVIDQLGRLSML